MTGDIYADFTCNRCGEASPPIKLDYWISHGGSIEVMTSRLPERLEAEGWEMRKNDRKDVENWLKTQHFCEKCVAREKRRAEILGEA